MCQKWERKVKFLLSISPRILPMPGRVWSRWRKDMKSGCWLRSAVWKEWITWLKSLSRNVPCMRPGLQVRGDKFKLNLKKKKPKKKNLWYANIFWSCICINEGQIDQMFSILQTNAGRFCLTRAETVNNNYIMRNPKIIVPLKFSGVRKGLTAVEARNNVTAVAENRQLITESHLPFR